MKQMIMNLKLIILVFCISFYSCTTRSNLTENTLSKETKLLLLSKRTGLNGNNIAEFISDSKGNSIIIDPVDDNINFKKVIDNIYTDTSNKLFIKNRCSRPIGDGILMIWEYYKDVSGFIELPSYRNIKDDYFQNKGKVYIWWGNSDGNFPIEVFGANPKSFIPFDKIIGGKDDENVFYINTEGKFQIVPEADTKTLKVLSPERDCWNCGETYFSDCESVYYGLNKIENADPKTFILLNQENVDAWDINGLYYKGKLVK